MVTDSIDEHTYLLDQTVEEWQSYADKVKDQPLLTSTRGHLIRSISKHFRQLQNQSGRPLGPIKTSLLGRGVTTEALTINNGKNPEQPI